MAAARPPSAANAVDHRSGTSATRGRRYRRNRASSIPEATLLARAKRAELFDQALNGRLALPFCAPPPLLLDSRRRG